MYNFTKRALNIVLFVFLCALFLLSCKESEEYPPVPQLTFKSFTNLRTNAGIDTMGIMILTFTDGDGDLGLIDKQDLTKPDNFIVYSYKMVNGQLKIRTLYNDETLQYDTINFNVRIPNLAPYFYKGWLRGEIEDTIRAFRDPTSTKPFDTIMFESYIFDRAGNKSNVVQTPLILVKNH